MKSPVGLLPKPGEFFKNNVIYPFLHGYSVRENIDLSTAPLLPHCSLPIPLLPPTPPAPSWGLDTILEF